MWRFSLVLSLILVPGFIFAATSITEVTLNNVAASATLNINDSAAKVDLNLTASEAVKWNTLAICLVSDTTCSRSTAVKYFTSTSAFNNNIVKTWDGKNSGGSAVAVGDYKLKATIKNEAGEESIIELTDYLIKVIAGELVTGGSNNQAGSNDNNSNSSADDSSGGSSAHLSSTPLSSEKTTVWQLDLGRERQVLVDQVIPFVAKDLAGAPTDSNLIWNFGDGWSGAGRAVFHRYSRPGRYEVVVNGHSNNKEAVARTKVTVVSAKLTLTWFDGEPGVVVVGNEQTSEINLGGLTLIASSTPQFTFSADTILSAGAKLSLDQELTKLTGKEEVILISPAGRVLATLAPSVSRAELLAAVGKLRQDLAVTERSLALKTPAQNIGVLNEKTKIEATTTSLKLSAKNNATWWQRWLKLIRVP